MVRMSENVLCDIFNTEEARVHLVEDGKLIHFKKDG